MKFIKTFFSKEYREFDDSQLEFRKSVLKMIQILSSVSVIIFMIIAFPSANYSLAHHIAIPSFLVLSNAIGFLIQRKRFEKYCPLYLLILLIIGQILSIELSFKNIFEFENHFLIYFSGLYAGITQILCFQNISSSLHKVIISISFIVQITIKDIAFGRDNIQIRTVTLFFILLFINFVFLKTEMLFFQMWSSLMKKNKGLEHFQMLFQNFPSHIIVLNKHSIHVDRPLYYNKEAEYLLEEVESPNMSLLGFLESFKIIKDDVSPTKEEEIQMTLKDQILKSINQSKDFEPDYSTFICDKGNNDKWSIKIGLIEWNQTDALIVIFNNDESKKEKIKELQMLDKNKNRMLATVSHELRTPINGTLGMIENAEGLLKDDQHDAKYCLDIAKNSAKTLLLMVNDILDLEQIRHGKLRLHLESANLHEIIQKVLPLIEIQIKHKNLKLIYENDCPRDTNVLVDASRLQQILWNLLWNACKFTSFGHIVLKAKPKKKKFNDTSIDFKIKNVNNISIDPREGYETELFLNNYSRGGDEFQTVQISVEDTGMGMDAQTLEHLFQEFGKKENSCNPTGVGLGLAISQSLVKQMNSTGIVVQSEYGKGSIFCFNLDVSTTDDYKQIPAELPSINMKHLSAEESTLFNQKAAKNYEVLLVDDDLVNHCVFDLYFKCLSPRYSMEKAHNGEEAIKIVMERANNGKYFDLILMDCNMPIMDGFQATAALRQLIFKGQIPEVKIIALTASDSASEKAHCLELGMSDVWSKPITKSDFLNNIKRGVREKQY